MTWFIVVHEKWKNESYALKFWSGNLIGLGETKIWDTMQQIESLEKIVKSECNTTMFQGRSKHSYLLFVT